MNVKVTTRYQAVIFFETDDEDAVEHTLSLRTVLTDPDLANYSFGPGSPASSPYVTVEGQSKTRVQNLANYILAKLKQIGVRFVE